MKEFNAGQKFMQETKYQNISPAPQAANVPQPPLELDQPKGEQPIELLPHDQLTLDEISLRQAVENRRTLRAYDSAPLCIDEVTYLLWLSQGVRRVSSRPSTARNVPSAGARHAFETLLLVNRVKGLEPGLYRYMAIENTLIKLDAPAEITARVRTACMNQGQIEGAAVVFLWVAVVERMYWRYTERGYRYLHLDAGHVCQNLALGAEQIGAGICPIAAFDDDSLNQALGLDGEDQFVIYLASVGKKSVKAG